MDLLFPDLEPCEAGTAEPFKKPTAIIVSDVLLYRDGLSASLARDDRVTIVDSVSSVDALPVISRVSPDIVLVDGAADSCLQLARRLRAMLPRLRIVGFGISGGEGRIVDCAEAGLAAFVDSDGNVAALVDAIFGALNGELACSPRVSALMCERLARLAAGSAKSGSLTRREKEIAVLIGQGLSNKEIANDLCIGPATVKNHVHSILEKLQVRRRSAIVHQLSEFI